MVWKGAACDLGPRKCHHSAHSRCCCCCCSWPMISATKLLTPVPGPGTAAGNAVDDAAAAAEEEAKKKPILGEYFASFLAWFSCYALYGQKRAKFMSLTGWHSILLLLQLLLLLVCLVIGPPGLGLMHGNPITCAVCAFFLPRLARLPFSGSVWWSCGMRHERYKRTPSRSYRRQYFCTLSVCK